MGKSDGDECAGEEKEKEDGSGCGWTASMMTRTRRDYRAKRRKTGMLGGD